MFDRFYRDLSDRRFLVPILIFSCLITLVLVPYRAYLLTRVAVGRPSPITVVSPIDVDVVDEEATEKLRQRIKETSPVVYRLDNSWTRRVYETLSRTFFILRGLYARGQLDTGKLGDVLKSQLGVELPKADLALLIESGFSFDFEEHISKVLKRLSGYYIVDEVPGGGFVIYDPMLKRYYMPDTSAPLFTTDSVRGLVKRLVYEVFPLEEQKFAPAVVDLLVKLVKPTLYMDRELTRAYLERRLSSVEPVRVRIKKGEVVVSEGQKVTPQIYRKLKVLADMMDIQPLWRTLLGLWLLVLVSAIFFSLLWKRLYREGRIPFYQAHRLALFIVFESIFLIRLFSWLYSRVLVPYAPVGKFFIGMASPLFLSGLLSVFLFGYSLALVPVLYVGILSSFIPSAFYYMPFAVVVSSLGAGGGVRTGRGANAFFRGIFLGVLTLILISFGAVVYESGLSWGVLFAPFMAGVAVFFSSFASLPLFERGFGVVTDISLLELANLDHPLLRMLLEKAPGTYNHSIYVGILAESAAKEVGANPILAKVGGYFHDIGKLKNPKYFIENTMGVSMHEKLSPNMSRLIIISHVKDGVELARQYGLPKCVVDIIEQHHGTSLISYFYHKAKKSSEEVDESLYRYPGPKPRSKEAAIVMLADSVEAATRSLDEPTPSRIKALVSSIVNGIFTDGQLDECELTFRDVRRIQEIFVKMLISFYHKRIKYPEQRENGDNADKSDGGKAKAQQDKVLR